MTGSPVSRTTAASSAASALFAAALGLLAPATARAESYSICTGFIDALPAVISTPGNWCLRKDLSTGLSTGAAITLTTNNVTIDCNGYRIGGLAAGAGTGTSGVYASARLNQTVRHCAIRGFLIGIRLDGGGGHLVADNRLDANTWIAMRVSGDGSVIRRNRVFDTGGSTRTGHDGWAAGIVGGGGIGSPGGGVDIVDNVVTNVAPTPFASGHGTALGIQVDHAAGSTVADNRVRDLVPLGEGVAMAIRLEASPRSALLRNVVVGPGDETAQIGLSCDDPSSRASGNVLMGLWLPMGNCTDDGNAY